MQPRRAVIFLALLGLSIANRRISPNVASPEKENATSGVEKETVPARTVDDNGYWMKNSIEIDESEIQQAIKQKYPTSNPTVSEKPCDMQEIFACILQNRQDTVKKQNVQMSEVKPKPTVNGDQQQSTSVSQFPKGSGTSETIRDHAVPETSHPVQVTSEAQSTLPKKENENEVAATGISINNDQPVNTDAEELVREIEKLFKGILERSHSTTTPFVIDPLTPATTVKRGSFMTDNQEANQMSDKKPESIVNGGEQKSTSLPTISKETTLTIKETIPDHAVPESYPVQLTYEAQSGLPKDQNISVHDEEEVATTVVPTKNEQQDNGNVDELVRELEELSRLAALERQQSTSIPFVNLIDPVTPATPVKTSSLETDYQPANQMSDKKPESTIIGDEQKSISLYQFSKESPVITKETIPDHAVPETSYPVQVTSEAQSTLPAKNQVNPIHDEEEVNTTGIPINNGKRDNSDAEKLVRELEELPRLAAFERSHSTAIPFVNSIDPVTPAAPIKRNSLLIDYQAANEDEKRRIQANMAKEIREMHRLGVSNNEIIEVLGVNKQEIPGGFKLVKIGQDTEVHKVQDSNADELMNNKISHNTWRPYATPYPAKPYTNDSIERMHFNLHPMNEYAVTNQLRGGYRLGYYNSQMRTNPRNIQNTLRKLQRENYLLKMRLMSYTQPNANMRPIRRVIFAGPNRISQYLPRQAKYPTELSLGKNVPGGNPGGAPILPPYPYIKNSDIKNVTLPEDTGNSSSLVSKPEPPIVNSEFSDEMKRELRDGKVILLSDSVVRSNFEPEKEKDEGGKETKVIPPEVGQKGIWQHFWSG